MVASKSQAWRIGNVNDELEQPEKAASEDQPAVKAEIDEEQPGSATEKAASEQASPEEDVELAALREELQSARAKEAEYLDGWQRARAELSNARKRFRREQEQSYQNAKADLLVRLLPIVDDFERAFATLPEDQSGLPWTEGVWLILHKLRSLLDQEGVAPIEVSDRAFDPFLHQAVTHEPSTEVEEGHIIDEVQKGYKVGDRVLRPSVVRVSAGPPSEAEPEVEDEQKENAEPVVE
jgi:molecular chaperone GrpE